MRRQRRSRSYSPRRDSSSAWKRKLGNSKGFRDGNRDKMNNSGSRSNDIPRLGRPYWKDHSLKPFKRNFYTPHPDVEDRSTSDIEDFQEDNEITIVGSDVPRPIRFFREAGFPNSIMREIRRQGFIQPTVIQAQGWPIALSGRDMIAIAKTGSGKTLSYILPAIVHVRNQPRIARGEGPIVLVVAPTRELAQQIKDVAKDFCSAAGIYDVCLFGGGKKHLQVKELQKIPEIVIATPGRLLDLASEGKTNFKRTTFVVLDEADRMLDMGFEPQIRQIMTQIRPDRQILMWSATWPNSVIELAREFLKDHVQVNVGSLKLCANHNILQIIDVCQEKDKEKKLSTLLKEIMSEKENKTIVFIETKKRVDDITWKMKKDGWPAESIHGDKTQSERDTVMQAFRDGKTPILVATDVAARGLDVDDVKFVINFDFPGSTEDYVHRIGRTGRNDKTGTAYTFFTPKNATKAKDLIGVLKEAKQVVTSKLVELAQASGREKIMRHRNRVRRRRNASFSKNLDRDRKENGRRRGRSLSSAPSTPRRRSRSRSRSRSRTPEKRRRRRTRSTSSRSSVSRSPTPKKRRHTRGRKRSTSSSSDSDSRSGSA